jgi:hypothetical protein
MEKASQLSWSRSSCIFSPCRTWRYTLERWWGEEGAYANFLCLNPSTADEEHNDPTVTRCCHYAKDWGYDGCIVTNIFGLRSTDPHALLEADDPVGQDNDEHILDVARNAGIVIAAWGAWGKIRNRGLSIASHLSRAGVPLHCLGRTKEGHPRHPLYLPAAARPVRYSYASVTTAPDPLQRRRSDRQAEIQRLGNGDLLEETLRMAGGDDYDGCFTDFGQWEYGVLRAELEERLRDWLAAGTVPPAAWPPAATLQDWLDAVGCPFPSQTSGGPSES